MGGAIGIGTRMLRTVEYAYILIVFLLVHLLEILLLGNPVALLFWGLASVHGFVTFMRDGLSLKKTSSAGTEGLQLKI